MCTSGPGVPPRPAARGQAHPASLPVRRLGAERRLALVPAGLAGAPGKALLLPAGVGLGGGVGDVDGDALDDVILATQGLGHLGSG